MNQLVDLQTVVYTVVFSSIRALGMQVPFIKLGPSDFACDDNDEDSDGHCGCNSVNFLFCMEVDLDSVRWMFMMMMIVVMMVMRCCR